MPPGGEMPPSGPMPTADSIYKQYRTAAETMNSIFFNRVAMSKLEQNEFISEYDREINEKFAVTGRSYFGEIPENLEPATPWNFTPIGEPMGYLAEKDVRLAKVKSKQVMHGYTNLEKKLYKIVMSLNAPLAFFAQYEAGPSKNYTLDGAFPHIKLGVEADGEIWHNNPNKIEQDKQRDVNLARQGWTILRFTDKEVEKQPRDVAMVIQQAVQKLLGVYGYGGQQTV
jgi:very-short-patch-repair endonuclease